MIDTPLLDEKQPSSHHGRDPREHAKCVTATLSHHGKGNTTHMFDDCVASAKEVGGDAAGLSQQAESGSSCGSVSPARPVEASPTIAALRMKRLNAKTIRLSSDAGWKGVGLAWISHTRTLWSSEAESTRSSLGWKLADMT